MPSQGKIGFRVSGCCFSSIRRCHEKKTPRIIFFLLDLGGFRKEKDSSF
jgi:hypothetical protein